ncbi:MAG TPA: type IV pilus assembly protein PilM [Candidatus Woesebacteria bacterium]|nr:type IV pilus assembly protein PilM [Candidatus Woesebacteria bacterium]
MKSIAGIDMGLGSIKVVALDRVGEVMSLMAIGEVKTPNQDWMKSEVTKKSLEEVAKSLKSLINDLKIGNRAAVIALPEYEIVSRLVSLPPLEEKEIKDALTFEAETFVPYPLDKVSIDYEVIEEDEGGRLTVFAIAARNDLISNYIKIFKAVGMELLAIESPAVSMRRILKQIATASEATMVLDIGQKYSDLIGFKNGNIYFARSISLGGESITRAISVNLGLDMASAEEYKKAYGIKEMELEGKIKSAIMPVFESMAEEIRRAMALYSESNNQAIELLVLSGGGAKLPGLAEEFTRILGIEVQVIQPFLKIDSQKIVSPINLEVDGYRFSTAVGLALREGQ